MQKYYLIYCKSIFYIIIFYMNLLLFLQAIAVLFQPFRALSHTSINAVSATRLFMTLITFFYYLASSF